MIYVLSDIHGCYEEYCELLETIQFSLDDELYVLGDVVDRGPEPLKVLLDMMNRPNVQLILGNHDYLMMCVMSKLSKEINEENLNNGTLDENLLMDYVDWMNNGGEVTAKQFIGRHQDEILDILEYVQDALIYEIIDVNKKRYLLTHAGIMGFDEHKDLDDYHFTDFLFNRIDYSQRYFSDNHIFVVSGHTPTCLIRQDEQHLVFEDHQHIAIDCGCVFGGKLAAYCLDTGSITYVDSKQKEV